MEESFTGCAGSADAVDRDRTPATSWPRSQVLAQRPTRVDPWPADAVVEPPPGLWRKLEERLREENIIRR